MFLVNNSGIRMCMRFAWVEPFWGRRRCPECRGARRVAVRRYSAPTISDEMIATYSQGDFGTHLSTGALEEAAPWLPGFWKVKGRWLASILGIDWFARSFDDPSSGSLSHVRSSNVSPFSQTIDLELTSIASVWKMLN